MPRVQPRENNVGFRLCIVWKISFWNSLGVLKYYPACRSFSRDLPCNPLDFRVAMYIKVAEFNKNMNATVEIDLGANAKVLQDDVAVKNVQIGRSPAANQTESDFKEFLNHPILLQHATWTAASTNITIPDIVATYFSTIAGTPMAAKLQNFAYFSSVIRIKVVIQGQPYAAGQVVFAFTPMVGMKTFATVTDVVVVNNFVNAKIVPHLVVDPSKTMTYEIDLPVCTPNNQYGILTNLFGSYEMNILPYNPLTSGTATAPSIGICVYMSLVDPKFEGLTLLSNDFVEEKEEGGFLSNFAKGVGKYSPILSVGFPEFAPAINLFSKVSTGIGDVLALLGFSKPPATDNKHFIFNRLVDNYSQFDGVSTAIVLGGSQSTGAGISPSLGGGNPNDLLLSSLRAKKGLVKQLEISPASASGYLQDSIIINPMLCFSNASLVTCPTPLAGTTLPFQYWCGDIDVTIEFVCSVFHRATVLLAWDPLGPTTSPTLNNSLTVLQNVTVNISGNTTVEITIPYKQVTPWLLTGVFDSTGALVPNGYNGMLMMFIINPVTSNGSTDGIWYNVYFSSKNFKTGVPASVLIQNLPLQTKTAPATLLSAEFAPVTKVSFGPKTDLSLAELKSFGESYNSVKQLTSKVSRYYTGQINVDNSSTPLPYVTTYLPNYPRPLFRADNGGLYASTCVTSFFTYFAAAYLGYRGGVRYKLHVSDNSDFYPSVLKDHYWAWQYSLSTPATIGANPSFASNIPNAADQVYAFTQGNRSICPNLDIVVPNLYPNDFIPTRDRTTAYNNLFEVALPIYKSQTTDVHSVQMTISHGSADDGNFVWFLGFPAWDANP